MTRLLIYGANGYTGALIAREAVRRDLRPILAGRHRTAIEVLAAELRLESRVFGLDDPSKLDEGLTGIAVALNCAGPFAYTARPMADACLRTRVHYLDITGEVDVFETMASLDGVARERGVTLLPGVGFDVVPSDCLAAHLHRRLPSATRLTLAFQALTKISRGTTKTIIESFSAGGMIRRNGVLTRVPAGWKSRRIDFGNGPTMAMTIPWGDVVTAFHSTAIPNIEVYTAAPWTTRVGAKVSRSFKWLLGSRTVKQWLIRRVEAGPAGPTDEQRQKGKSLLWGEVSDDAGRTVVSRLAGPESYAWTVQTSLAVARKVLEEAAVPGFQTPAKLFGADFILDGGGVMRCDGV